MSSRYDGPGCLASIAGLAFGWVLFELIKLLLCGNCSMLHEPIKWLIYAATVGLILAITVGNIIQAIIEGKNKKNETRNDPRDSNESS